MPKEQLSNGELKSNEDLEDDFEVEIEDDTPEEDRNRDPMPKEVADDFEADDFEEYDEKVKQRLKQAKKLFHDERREKERVAREHSALILVEAAQ